MVRTGGMFIGDPVLAKVKKDGKVITSSGKISAYTDKASAQEAAK